VDVADLEEYVAQLQHDLTRPRDRECLVCYVSRMLDEFGCDTTLRWAQLWRDACAPRAVGLERRLEARGGFCDCEIAFNVYPDLMLNDTENDQESDYRRLECLGVSRRGSTKPCGATSTT
jgi:Protein of unknown function (DUF2695)